MPTYQEITVLALWNDEASVWVAESEQVPGLVTEADTLELLASKLERLVPELLELNAPELKDVSTIHLKAERTLHAV